MFKLLIIMLKLIILFAFNLLSACLVRRLWFKTSGQIEFHLSWAYSEHPERFSSCLTLRVSGVCVCMFFFLFRHRQSQPPYMHVHFVCITWLNLSCFVLFCNEPISNQQNRINVTISSISNILLIAVSAIVLTFSDEIQFLAIVVLLVEISKI